MCVKLETARLKLRPPELKDMQAVLPLIGDYDVAKNLANAPHPYEAQHWVDFIARTTESRARGTGFAFMIVRKSDCVPMGMCGVRLNDGMFELGYWLGKPYWGEGFATEAARRVCAFALFELKCDRLSAAWFADNPASGRVLEKLGFVATGTDLRESKARGVAVECRTMRLDRENYGRRKVAA